MEQLTPAEARTLLARAFVDDPLMVWFFPDAETRPHACAALLGLFAEHYLRNGRVDVVGGGAPVAVAMWRWPGGPDRDEAARTGGAMSVIADLRPPEPYAYLHLLGVDPAARGRGLGGEVLGRGVTAAREAGLVACLETMNAANLPFYARHGFQVRHEIPLAHGGPTVWAMATPGPEG